MKHKQFIIFRGVEYDVNYIYTIDDLTLFATLKGNRSLDLKNLSNLRNKITKDGWLDTIIIVNENFEIIDGQHRIYLAKELGLSVTVVIRNGWGLHEAIMMNITGKRWDDDDIAQSHYENGRSEYGHYLTFRDSFSLPTQLSVAILMGRAAGGEGTRKIFSSGEFKVADLDQAYSNAAFLLAVRPYFIPERKSIPHKSNFMSALLQCMKNKGFKQSRFIEQLKAWPAKIVDCTRTEEFERQIQNLYDFHARGKDRIF